MSSSSEDSDDTEDQDSSSDSGNSDSGNNLQNNEQSTDKINQNNNCVKGTQSMKMQIAANSPLPRASPSKTDHIENAQQAVGVFQAVWRRKQIRKIARIQQATTIQQQVRQSL